MRFKTTWLLSLLAAVAMVATTANAESQDELREMRELVLQLQDQLQSQQKQINEQQTVMEEAGIEDIERERGAFSSLSSFLENTEFSGWVAASYFWNFNKPNNGRQEGGNSTLSNPFHADHNTFQFDEAWFVMSKEATEEDPAGFHFEITYGATATALAEAGNIARGTPGTTVGNQNGNDLWVNQANVSYMTPWGQTVTAGKFGTLIGYEIAGAANNVNITRGFAYNQFQPFSQTGILVGQDFDSGFTYTVGAVNGISNEQFDTNAGKAFMWQVGWGNDTFTALFNGLYDHESEASATNDDALILDVVLELTPSDNLLFWANYDYFSVDNGGTGGTPGPREPDAHALALGGRVGLTDDFGIGGRFEFAHLDADTGSGGGADDGQIYSYTFTTDYALTDNLVWKVEYKYEMANNDPGAFFGVGATDQLFAHGGSGGVRDDVHYLGTQIYYQF